MKSTREKFVLCFVIIGTFFQIRTAQITDPDVSFTFDDTHFGFFETSLNINQSDAQTQCINWGGKLATITSAIEDSLLFYSIPDLETTFSCHIGLNDIENEAGINGSTFIWIDGKNSTYRNWGMLLHNFPLLNVNYSCVRHRYRDSGILSQGWLNIPCSQTRNCYFCNKQGMSNQCDLIYNSSCYKLFEVSTPINWLDAQSSCAIWGGDLTSITTERENNYLNTMITSSVGNVWIGLNDRDEEGTYTWIDGTAVSYTNWTSTPSDDVINNCVQINNTGNGIWESVSCESKLSLFICKASSILTTVESFGELTNGGLNFQTINENTFLFSSRTLACGGEENTTISWKFSQASDFTFSEELSAMYSSLETGLSWLDVDSSKQGYYQCQIGNGTRYIVGLYDQTTITFAVSGSTYTYTVGIDRVDTLLLCDPNDDSIYLGNLMWGIGDGDNLTNPINISEWISTSPQQLVLLKCLNVGSEIITVIAVNYVPTFAVSPTESSGQLLALYPANNIIMLKVRTEDFSLSANLPGRWQLPDDTFIEEQSISHAILNDQHFGLYRYLINNWDGNEVVAIQIRLIPEGLSMESVPISNDSTIILSRDNLMIDCAASSLSDNIEWTITNQTDGVVTNKTSLATISEGPGFSTLVVASSEPGYYSCIINTQSTYTFSVVNGDSLVLVRINSLGDPLQQVNFTVDSAVSLLYYPSSLITQASVPDSDVNWTNDVVVDGDDKIYIAEYPNPADLNTVFSNIGGGVHTFSCFYRTSPVTLLGSLQLALKDTATITVNYQGSNTTFSDANNPMFPSAQEINIPVGTTDIELTCSLPECIWMISNEASVTTMQTYTISAITESYNAKFSLIRMTGTGNSYTTAHVHIYADYVQAVPTSTTQSNGTLVAVVVTVSISIIILALIAILVPLFMFFYVKRRNAAKLPKPSTPTINENAVFENLSTFPLSSKEYENTSLDSNYVTIDETSIVTLEPENGQRHRGYINVADKSPYDNLFEQNNETSLKTNVEYNPTYKMSSARKKFISKFIPIKEFPAIYQQYVDSGVDKYSLFSHEFSNLTEESRNNIELETDEALKVENNPKNPLRNIVPYNESRIVLNSPYFDCNYINASDINGYEFIASIHPTKETHRDFLQMIYQTEASMVIMLTTRREKAKIISGISNRVCYWPKKEEPIECEPFLITLINSTETAAFIKQEISVKNTLDKKEHTFIHCISPIWNEDSTVAEMSPALTLLSRILKQIQDVSSKPIIIHCEDGISKTGILLSGIDCVKELDHKESINIFNSVMNLRRQRMKMVPTLACYTTCYSLMNEYCSIHL